ncbi:ubiquinol-cytochrome C reductase [Diaporthe sp. PMI_573]|nr:ubiquinol-cytochrome C reductase [Diaporthaceae sp. PMI_573]
MSTSQLHLFGYKAPQRRIAILTDHSSRTHYRSSLALSHTLKMAGQTTIYNVLFRSNYAMLATVFAGAFGFQMAYDVSTTKFWDNMNRGRQWKDIKHKYLEGAEEEE